MIAIENDIPHLIVGVAEISQVNQHQATPDFNRWFTEQLTIARERVASPEWENRRNEVRALLRTGGFKPSGRSKPAQEYLLRCLNEPPFPRVNIPVDCLNLYSIQCGFPISLLRRDRVPHRLRIRFGKAGETFVFNSAGQQLDLEGLICVCGGELGDEPLGTPVKDSMKGKIDDCTSEMIVILYASAERVTQAEMHEHAENLKGMIQNWQRAASPP